MTSTPDTPATIGRRIAAARKAKAYTQQDLAEEVGVTFQAVSKWETDASLPDVTLLAPIADTLGLSLDELLTGRRPAPAAATSDAPEPRAQWGQIMGNVTNDIHGDITGYVGGKLVGIVHGRVKGGCPREDPRAHRRRRHQRRPARQRLPPRRAEGAPGEVPCGKVGPNGRTRLTASPRASGSGPSARAPAHGAVRHPATGARRRAAGTRG